MAEDQMQLLPDMVYRGVTVVRSRATLADEMAYAALPEETRALAERVLGAKGVVDADAVEAYEMGWEDALEDMRYSYPSAPTRHEILTILNNKGR